MKELAPSHRGGYGSLTLCQRGSHDPHLAFRAAALPALVLQLATVADLIDFWDRPAKGANGFNALPQDAAYFQALAGTGATWVRLTFSKWKGQGRDFLIGNADHYDGLVAKDLAVLHEVLDAADAAGLKVVLTPLSLPGARWTQQNGGAYDVTGCGRTRPFRSRQSGSGPTSPPR